MYIALLTSMPPRKNKAIAVDSRVAEIRVRTAVRSSGSRQITSVRVAPPTQPTVRAQSAAAVPSTPEGQMADLPFNMLPDDDIRPFEDFRGTVVS